MFTRLVAWRVSPKEGTILLYTSRAFHSLRPFLFGIRHQSLGYWGRLSRDENWMVQGTRINALVLCGWLLVSSVPA